ncbi:MAG TPA: DUF6766 family protein [Flavobacteriales bacterium]|jgi:hypothetical protein|nr:DUF6766 family protein [Flavobacteriales bacterium]
MATHPPSFFRRNGLSLVLLALLVVFLAAQAYTGWLQHNDDLAEVGRAPLPFWGYLHGPHFLSATFENWESEFLQMGMYVLLTVGLRQKGSSESKTLDGKEEVDRQPKPHAGAPWPVQRGGWVLVLYRNSLSLAFFALFLLSFWLHLRGSYGTYVEEERARGLDPGPISSYLVDHRFWFESFQNWQSEFMAVAAIVVLSIWLRQWGSPESKPVDAPHSATGK